MEPVRFGTSTLIAAREQESGQRMDFSSAWTQWRAYRTSGSRPMAISTQQDYDSMYRRYIGPHFGHLPLEQVDAGTVVAFQLAMRAAGVSAVRYGKIVVPLRACLRWNFRRGTFARDTSYWFDKPAPPADERKTLSFEEVERLVVCLPDFYRPLVSFAAYTGLRFGELRALCWSDLDLEAGVCHVRRAMDRTVVRMYTKTKGSRAVGLPTHLRLELRAWRLQCPPGDGDLVFPSPSGAPLDPGAFRSRVFKPALAQAGLDRSFRIHDLRHTAASWYVRAGANVVDLMRVFGWTQMQTALRYIHMLETPTLLADMLEASRDGHLGT
jgi:integrase